MCLNDLAANIHRNNVAKGWWDAERNFGLVLALIHSEVSEALEEFRDGRGFTEIYRKHGDGSECDGACPVSSPEGIPVELADVLIRVLDACAGYRIDIDAAVALKMAYNETRPHKHGGKLA